MSVCVCLCLCVSARISHEPHVQISVVDVTCSRGYTLCTCGFVTGVTFAGNWSGKGDGEERLLSDSTLIRSSFCAYNKI